MQFLTFVKLFLYNRLDCSRFFNTCQINTTQPIPQYTFFVSVMVNITACVSKLVYTDIVQKPDLCRKLYIYNAIPPTGPHPRGHPRMMRMRLGDDMHNATLSARQRMIFAMQINHLVISLY